MERQREVVEALDRFQVVNPSGHPILRLTSNRDDPKPSEDS